MWRLEESPRERLDPLERFWSKDAAEVFRTIVSSVRFRAQEGGFEPSDDDIAAMFNIVVTNYAYSAHKNRKLKKAIKKAVAD